MNFCTNMLAESWPGTTVARATRHDRRSQGGVFGLGLLESYRGIIPMNSGKPEAGR